MSARRDYHRAYYAANAERRREQKRKSLMKLGKAHRHIRELIASDIKRDARAGTLVLCEHPGCRVEVHSSVTMCYGHRRLIRRLARGTTRA